MTPERTYEGGTERPQGTFWTDLAKKARGYAEAAKKSGEEDIARTELEMAEWCEMMHKEFEQ